MVRAFRPDPVPDAVIDDLIDLARRAPSAGNSQGSDFVVLTGDDVTRLWDVTLPLSRRGDFAWPALLSAPVLIVAVADPRRYLDRYSEADKSTAGLGETESAWAVPYWTIDTAMATMTLLHAAVDRGLGALFFGLFDHTEAVKATFGLPDAVEPIGAVALGYADPGADRPSRSAGRPRRPLDEVIHRGGW